MHKQPEQPKQPEPQPQAGSVVLTKAHLHCWTIFDCKRLGNGAIPAWEFDTLPTHDIIKRHGL
jgi:hypothetical protein